MDGKSIEQIFGGLTDKRIKNKIAEIKDSVKGELSQNDIFVIKECLETVKFLDAKIKEFDSRIFQSLSGMRREQDILMSIPGIGFYISCCCHFRIGDIKVFPKPKNLVSWGGLAQPLMNLQESPLMAILPNMVINICERSLFKQLIQLLSESLINSGSFTRESKQRRS